MRGNQEIVLFFHNTPLCTGNTRKIRKFQGFPAGPDYDKSKNNEEPGIKKFKWKFREFPETFKFKH